MDRSDSSLADITTNIITKYTKTEEMKKEMNQLLNDIRFVFIR